MFLLIVSILVKLNLAVALCYLLATAYGFFLTVREKEILHGNRQIYIRDYEDQFGEYVNQYITK